MCGIVLYNLTRTIYSDFNFVIIIQSQLDVNVVSTAIPATT